MLVKRRCATDGAAGHQVTDAHASPPSSKRALDEDKRRRGEAPFRLLFRSNPLPMWVYDIATLAFLEVNDAAVRHYGYSRDEFLAMRLSDMRPAEEVAPLLDNITTGWNTTRDSS